MPKFTAAERDQVQSIVANLSIKRIPTELIRQHVFNKTGKTLSERSLYYIKQRLKRESYHWYTKLREGEYEYIHEFKERINEIVDLQRQHHEIIIKNEANPSIVQTSLIALHKLNVTLSSYYDIVPYLTVTGQRLEQTTEAEAASNARMDIIENCTCRQNGGCAISHSKCLYCHHFWCPRAMGQDWCPNPQCTHGIAGCKFQPYDDNYTWIKCNCGMWFQKQEILDAHLSAYPHNNNSNQ